MSVMSGLKSTALHQWECRMQGYTNGVSIFQRDFAVKQDYPGIIGLEIFLASDFDGDLLQLLCQDLRGASYRDG